MPDDDNAVAGWQLSSLIGPKPYEYLNPSGLAYSLLTQSSGFQLVEPAEDHFPFYKVGIDTSRAVEKIPAAGPDTVEVDYLETLAAISGTGDSLIIFVLNRASGLEEAKEEYHDINANVMIINSEGFSGINIMELNGNHLWDINSVSEPVNVSISPVSETEFTDSFSHSFPAHSLTMILAYQRGATIDKMPDARYPASFLLYQNYPNPFNPSTIISFDLPRTEKVTIELFNTLGERINRLLQKQMQAGHHQIEWPGVDESGNLVASGLYICKVSAGESNSTCKMIFIR